MFVHGALPDIQRSILRDRSTDLAAGERKIVDRQTRRVTFREYNEVREMSPPRTETPPRPIANGSPRRFIVVDYPDETED